MKADSLPGSAASVTGARRKRFVLDQTLEGIDALCNRWAEETWDYYGGSASSIWRAMREREGAMQPGGTMGVSNDTLALDQVLAHSEERYCAMVVVWYRDSGSIDQKAKRLGTNRADIYGQWRRTLEYLRGRLHAIGVNV